MSKRISLLLLIVLVASLYLYTAAGRAIPAGAVLSKGLIGLVFPLLIIILFLIWARDLRSPVRFHLWKGWTLFIALTLPWRWLAARRNPGFLWHYFINEHLLRFLGKRQPIDYESTSLPIFWGLVLLWFFPWSDSFPALRHVIGSFDRRQAKTRAVVWMSLSWILVALVFFLSRLASSGPQRIFFLFPDDWLQALKLDHTYVVMNSAGRTLLCNRKLE
jgi:4-amino-4-deoxy-L-arabinose transferase-like glycosyltransferase